MQEEFLHYLWEKGFEKKSLVAVTGEKVVIMNTGEHNRDAGPDFFNAMVRIEGTTWAGSVEIHVKASDWARHGHDRDPAYDNVVLHAVYEYDAPVYRSNGQEIPAVVMKGFIPKKAYQAYLDFLNNHLWIPCANEIGTVNKPFLETHLEELSFQRLFRRSGQIMQLLADNKGDWNQAFFISLAGTMGTKINKEPFEMLARKTPVHVLLKCRHSNAVLEALFFGQAGFLEADFKEDYPRLLKREYRHLQHKFSLENIPVHLWKFLRLRPVNFPTVRLAQLASIYSRHPLPFSSFIDEANPARWKEMFDVEVGDYWKTHYHLDKPSSMNEKGLGNDMTTLILINTVAPMVYTFGKMHDKLSLCDRGLEILANLPPENNAVLKNFNYFGIEFSNAMHTQGALELKKQWCDQRACLDCKIGQELLKKAFEI